MPTEEKQHVNIQMILDEFAKAYGSYSQRMIRQMAHEIAETRQTLALLQRMGGAAGEYATAHFQARNLNGKDYL